MKKRFPLVAAVLFALALLLIAAAFLWLKKESIARPSVAVAQLAPADTLLFAQLTDAPRTAARWRGTELFRLIQEPEVQAFLERPLAQAPALAQWRVHADQLAKTGLRQAFIAVISLDGQTPRFTAGFSYSGSRADAEALLAEPRRALRNAWPAGKAELTTHAGTEVEVYSEKGNTVAEAFRDGWYFVSNDLALLQGTLDRQSNLARAADKNGSLAGDDLFQKATKPLPVDADVSVFLRSKILMERLSGVLAAAGQNLGPTDMSELKKTTAIAASTKLDGVGFRDTIFMVSGEDAAKEAPLPRQTLRLSTADTVLFYSAALPTKVEIPAALAPAMAFAPALATAEQALAAKGLAFADLGLAFGPELSTLLDWPQTAGQPSLLVSLAVRDAAKAKGFADALAGEPGTPGAWTRTETSGTTLYTPAATAGAVSLFGPHLAITDRALLVGITPEAITEGLRRLNANGAGLSESPNFQAASKTVVEPTTSFAFLDLRKLVDRAYGMLRPFLAMSLAFNPDASRYVDASKLPGTETLSRHLGPIVYSQSVVEGGTLIESVGALTFHQAIFGGAAAAGAMALPAIQQQLQSGAGLPIPPLAPPTPSVPPVAPPAPSAEPGSPNPPVEAFHGTATKIPS